MRTPEPNVELGRLYRETGWTMRQCAQAINRIGTERGTPVQYSAPSVHQWLNGGMPRETTRPLILEAFARKLGRPVSSADAGFPASMETNGDFDTVNSIVDLGKQDLDPTRRNLLGAGLFSVAITIPGWPDLVGRMEAIRTDPRRRIGQSEVKAVAAMTDRLSDLDDEFGGRYTRPMAAAFLVNTVAPHLEADTSSENRDSMISAAAFLCYLTGWMAVDEGLHGLAQQYYVKGLELAGASRDHLTYCHILRGMSVQAASLGHGTPAVRLADAAAEASPLSTPRMRAFLSGQQAHSYALAGERENAMNSLRETERAVNQAESQIGTFGGYSSATLAYTIAEVKYAFGDAKGSVDSLQEHFRLRDSSDRKRTEMRFGSLLAERQMAVGYLDEACATWGKVVDDYPEIHSGQIDGHMAEMFRLIRPHLKNRAARELYERARMVTPDSVRT